MPRDTTKRSVRPAAKKKRPAPTRVSPPRDSALDHLTAASNGGKKTLRRYGKKHFSKLGKLGNAKRWAAKKA